MIGFSSATIWCGDIQDTKIIAFNRRTVETYMGRTPNYSRHKEVTSQWDNKTDEK